MVIQESIINQYGHMDYTKTWEITDLEWQKQQHVTLENVLCLPCYQKSKSHQRAGIRFCHHLHMFDSPSVKIHQQSTCCMILYHTTKLRPLLFASLFYTLTFRRGVASLVVSSLPSTKPDALKQTIQQLPTSIYQATVSQSVRTSYFFKMAKPSATWH